MKRLLFVGIVIAGIGAASTPPQEAKPARHGKPGRCNECHPPYDICLPPCLELGRVDRAIADE